MNDDKLEQFFSEMKRRDRDIHVSPYPESKKRPNRSTWLAIAASVTIAIVALLTWTENQVQDPLLVEVSLEKPRSTGTLIEESGNNFGEWESPTKSLSSDF